MRQKQQKTYFPTHRPSMLSCGKNSRASLASWDHLSITICFSSSVASSILLVSAIIFWALLYIKVGSRFSPFRMAFSRDLIRLSSFRALAHSRFCRRLSRSSRRLASSSPVANRFALDNSFSNRAFRMSFMAMFLKMSSFSFSLSMLSSLRLPRRVGMEPSKIVVGLSDIVELQDATEQNASTFGNTLFHSNRENRERIWEIDTFMVGIPIANFGVTRNFMVFVGFGGSIE